MGSLVGNTMASLADFAWRWAVAVTVVVLLAGCAADPPVINVEAVASARFNRDLEQCTVAVGQALFASREIRRCMEARGHRFLRHG
jgi:hypothetical protein